MNRILQIETPTSNPFKLIEKIYTQSNRPQIVLSPLSLFLLASTTVATFIVIHMLAKRRFETQLAQQQQTQMSEWETKFTKILSEAQKIQDEKISTHLTDLQKQLPQLLQQKVMAALQALRPNSPARSPSTSGKPRIFYRRFTVDGSTPVSSPNSLVPVIQE